MEIPGLTLSCRELVELVTEYLEGAMSEVESARVEQHLALCIGCRRYVDQMRKTIEISSVLREDDVAPEAFDALRGAFRAWKRNAAPAKPGKPPEEH